MTIDKEM